MLKRCVDITLSCCALLLLSPVWLCIAWRVHRHLGAPILFRQVRPGKDAQPFEMIKFRTMHDAVDNQGNPLADAERLTPFGDFLRASSLDEIPGLWNVLKGDMSLVGPRPLLMEYVPLYNEQQYRRHQVRPGITGWAQVNGRNTISWEDKFKLDIWYVENQSWWLDIKILWLTLYKVGAREGVNAVGEATMPKFTGSPCQVPQDNHSLYSNQDDNYEKTRDFRR